MGKRQSNFMRKELLKEAKREIEDQNGKEKVSKVETFMDKYIGFYMGKTSKKMVLYDKFPSLDDILDYYFEKSFLADHPLEEYGKFDIRKLAEVIKYVYSLYYDQEYQVLTFGYLKRTSFQVQEGVYDELKPNLCFLIGNDQTLEEYREYQGCFLGEEKDFYFSKKRQSLIALSPVEGTIRDRLGICCYGDEIPKNCFGYYDYLEDSYKEMMFLDGISIFDHFMHQKIRNYCGIEDTLSFPIHSNDQIIAKILLSIAIYKKNRGKVSLTNEDYQMIFYELFQDNSVQIEKSILKDIPKKLRYVSKK